jgi:hypothetical protein
MQHFIKILVFKNDVLLRVSERSHCMVYNCNRPFAKIQKIYVKPEKNKKITIKREEKQQKLFGHA